MKYQADTVQGDNKDEGAMDKFVVSNKRDKFPANASQQLRITDSLEKDLVVGCGLPPSIVEHSKFKRFLGVIEPRYSCVSR